MARHAPSTDTCQELQAAGFPVAEPIFTEILQELPATRVEPTSGLDYYLTVMRATAARGWMVGFFHPFQPPQLNGWLLVVKHDSLLEATAELWLKLQSEG